MEFDTNAISDMLEKAKKSNRQNAITGCLLFHQGYFIQLLEGNKTAVKSLFKKISDDKRHHDVRLLSTEEAPTRIFSEWSMVYQNSSNDVDRNRIAKRQLFDDIYHSSNAICHPGMSKLALWIEVSKILRSERRALSNH